MIRSTTLEETDELVAIASGTGVFKPIEIEALRGVLDDYHTGNTSPSHKAITYESDGRPIGFAYYAPTEMTDRAWHLFWIFVDRGTQSKGLGARIIRHIEDEIRATGGRVLIVETSSLPNYEPTRRFYLKLGYRHVATIPDLYADGDDMIVFWKRLSEPGQAK
ncbi:MAG TPA: GNAT family N-acetyltransferase [Gemmataceae bacterium]|nr:GNAT family N-acetyltransferase [Gemmataceae bacterium]